METCRGYCIKAHYNDSGQWVWREGDCACKLHKCVNYAMCGNLDPLWLLDDKSGRCADPCDAVYGRSFQFFAPKDQEEECPVCLARAEVYMEYPCGHRVCPACFHPRFLEGGPGEPSPSVYGLEVSAECDFLEYEDAINRWKESEPDEYAEWQSALKEWDEINKPRGNYENHVKLMRRCPMCRCIGTPASVI